MTADPLQPPLAPRLSASTLSARREHLLAEIQREHARTSPGISPPVRRRQAQRRIAISLVAVAAVLAVGVALAVAASQDWWFFHGPGAPTPVTSTYVVKTGTWNGTPWALVAYRTDTDGICWGIGPNPDSNPTGTGAAMACAPIKGVPTTPQTKPGTPPNISYLSGTTNNVDRYIAGPVVNSASEIDITLDNGETIRTQTFPAPADLGQIRFYATNLPADARPTSLTAHDNQDNTVATITIPSPPPGLPPRP